MKDRYWAERQNFNYFNEVVRLCRAYEPDGARVIDVGSGPTQLLRRLDWFGHRVALDRQFVPWRWRIKTIRADFLEYQPKHRFDLVLCLQVLEHLADPAPFARKLLATGRTVIITVPYKWPSGLYPPHVQDPVDEAKLQGWTGRTPSETRVVHDSRARLIAVYRETDGP
jgi:SAM-dependent methyltransferase